MIMLSNARNACLLEVLFSSYNYYILGKGHYKDKAVKVKIIIRIARTKNTTSISARMNI